MNVPMRLPALLAAVYLLTPTVRAEDLRDAVTNGPCEVTSVKDIAYSDAREADPVKHKLDLYLPRGRIDFPVLLFVHGGSWRNGDKKGYGPLGTRFAQNGIGTVVTNYRLTPQVMHPGHIQDVARAFAWTHRNIARYGGQPDQLFICGHSAGAHLAALLATDPGYLKAEKLALSDIKGVIAVSGVYVIKPLPMLVKAFGKDEEVCKKASPLEHVKGHHPPFLIAYADADFRYFDWMAEQMGKALQGCKCEATIIKAADRTHASIMIKAVRETGDPLCQAMLKFMTRHSGFKPRTKDK